jgi:hypothetical protein
MTQTAQLILVLGMHRSGTSAWARALRVLGADLGARLLPPLPCNPKGFFEDADVYACNKELLRLLGASWSHWPPPPALEQRRLAGGEAGAAALALLREKCAADAPVGLKDPRLSLLMPFWRPVLAAAGLRPHCLICLRSPQSVAASLARRDALGAEHSQALWVAHTLGALTGSAGLPRMLADYDALLRAPQTALERLSLFLNRPVDAAERAAFCNDFLDAALCHHRGEDAPSDPEGAPAPEGQAQNAAADPAPWGALARRLYAALRSGPDNTPPAPCDDLESPACARALGAWRATMRRLPPPPAGAPRPTAPPEGARP